MDETTRNYRTAEFAAVRTGADHEYKPSITLHSTAGHTKHIGISWAEFEHVAAVLTHIEPTPDRYEALGLAIAELLHLRRDKESGRYATSWGTKSPEGLGRTVARLVWDSEVQS
jgi:hypothetical protein